MNTFLSDGLGRRTISLTHAFALFLLLPIVSVTSQTLAQTSPAGPNIAAIADLKVIDATVCSFEDPVTNKTRTVRRKKTAHCKDPDDGHDEVSYVDCKPPHRASKIDRNLLVNHTQGCDGGGLNNGDLQASILAEVLSSSTDKVYLKYRTSDGAFGNLAIGKEWFGTLPATAGSEVLLTGKSKENDKGKSLAEFTRSISILRDCAVPGATGDCHANVTVSDGAKLKPFLTDLKAGGARF